MPALAAELIDLIISSLHSAALSRGQGAKNYLDKSQARQIAKCALVCRAWVPASRRILFYRVHVQTLTAHGFAKLFKKPERLTFLAYIRELEIKSSLSNHTWMRNVFPKIAKHLPFSVHTVALSGHTPYGMKPPFICAPLSGVTHFELVGTWKLKFADAVGCISGFPALEGLKIWLQEDWEDSAPPKPRLPPAETLRMLNVRVHDAEPLCEWMQESNAMISDLKVFFPHGSKKTSSESIARYIGSLASSLLSLALTFDTRINWNANMGPFPSVFLERNTRLQTLYVQSVPAHTTSLMKTAHLSTSLAITIVVPYPSNYRNEAQPPVTSDWAELDRMLELSARRLTLTRLVHTEADSHPVDGISEPIQQAFPLCVARGIVTESVEVDQRWYRIFKV
ncbi:hypothetical protein DFH06DRAFT_1312679 [Mycena polygramma]|nr:hypothetical protein DFH06DRAFT_1312679 [Mycena polygramma]